MTLKAVIHRNSKDTIIMAQEFKNWAKNVV